MRGARCPGGARVSLCCASIAHETFVTLPVLLGVLVLAASCNRSSGSPRERVLAKLPAASEIVFVAEGRALANPQIRAVLDVMRPQWPATLGCVIEAAQTG